MKRLLVLMMVLALAMMAVACDTGQKPDTPAPSVSESQGGETPKPTPGVSGKVVVRTSHKQADQDMFKEMFEDMYPDATLEFQYGSIGDTMAAVEAAKDNPDTDVVLGGLQATDGDKYWHLFEPYQSVHEADLLAIDPDHYYTYYTTQVMTFLVNTEVLAELGVDKIEGYADLLNPALKGYIMHADPAASSSSWRQLETMLAIYNGGTDDYFDNNAWDYVEKLMDNLDGKTTTKSADVTQKVIDGEYAVGLSYESTCVENVLKAQEAGLDYIELVYPNDGNTEVAFGAAIVKNAKNPEAAKAVIDLTCSKEYADARLELLGANRGTHKDAAFPEYLPKTQDLGLVELKLDVLRDMKRDLLDKYETMWTEKFPG